MGNCFSDPSSAEKKPKSKSTQSQGQGQRLGSGPAGSNPSTNTNINTNAPNGGAGRIPSTKINEPPRTLGGPISAGTGNGNANGGGGGDDGAARERALRAAEERAKTASSKGINSSNPKAGQLSAKLREERKAPLSPRQENERMMDRGEWN